MTSNDLTIEEQKLLTEWLGERWHETGERNYTEICHGFPEPRLDFTDWRVVGRLVEKLRSITQYNLTTEVWWVKHRVGIVLFDANPQLAICRAILSYLKEGEK